jgi:pimeloyl-ACP methyl ester carboxylesterase
MSVRGTSDARNVKLSPLRLGARVLEAGPQGEGEANVLIHGGPGSANEWDAALPKIGGVGRAIAFAYRASERPRS